MQNLKSNVLPVRSLRTTLTVAFISLCVLVLLVSSSLQIFFNINTQEKVLSTHQLLVAQGTARSVGSFIQEKFSILESTVWLTSLGETTTAKQIEILQSLLGIQPAFRQLVLFDKQGRLIARASRLPLGVYNALTNQLADYMHIQNLLMTKKISPVYIDSVSCELFSIISAPVINAFKDSEGILIAELNLKFMWNLIDRLKIGETGYAYVVDKQGNLLAFNDRSWILKGSNLSQLKPVMEFIENPPDIRPDRVYTYRGIIGTVVVGTYVPLENPDWAVITELPWTEAYRDVLRILAASVIIVLFMAVLAGIVGVSVARRLSIPLVNFTDIATRIAGGERELLAEEQGPREITLLARSFNSMTNQLQSSLGNLEQQVAEVQRTGKALHVSEERLRFALEGTSDGIWDWNLKTGKIYFSPHYCTMLGYNPEEFTEQPEGWIKLLHPDDSTALQSIIENVIKNCSSFSAEFRMKTKSGKWMWILSRGKVTELDQDNKALRLTGSNTDIHERKEAENEIHYLNESLEQRVAERTAQLETVNKDLEAFAYSVSHDLRAPLRAISGYTHILSEDYESKLNTQGRRLLKIISREAERMGQLIENLLQFSRLGRQPLQLALTDMNPLVHDVYNILSSNLKDRKIKLSVSRLPRVKADQELLRQLWQNLLDNSIKFTRVRSKARIDIKSRKYKKEIIFSISDNGAGFNMKYADKMFGVFQRLHDQEEFEGTGVGLALVRRIVQRHGGRIWAEGKENKGATFYFTLGH